MTEARGDDAVRRWLTGPRGAAVLVTVAVLAVLSAAPGVVRDWLATHWLFTYERGLGRRAVLGSIVAAVRGGEGPTLALVTVLSVGALGALVAVLVALVLRALQADPRPATVLLVGWLLVGPGTLRSLAQDLGRFDTVNLVLVVATLLLLLRVPAAAGLAAVAVVGALGVAIHEAFLVVHLPLLLAAVLLVHGAGRGGAAPRREGPTLFGFGAATWVAVALASLPALGVYLWVQLAAGIRSGQVPAVLADLRATADFHVSEDSLLVQARGLEEVRAYTTGGLAEAGPGLVALLLTTILLACLPTVLVVGLRLWRERPATGPGRPVVAGPRLLVLAGLAPLAMQPLAIDWGRWWVLAAVNLCAAALWWTAWRAARGPAAGTPAAGRPAAGAPAADPTRAPVDRGAVPTWGWVLLGVSVLLPAVGDTGGFRPVDPRVTVPELVSAFATAFGG